MKKKILLVLLVIVALFTVTGCGKSNNSDGKTNNTSDNKEIVTIQGEKFKLKSKTSLYDINYNENYVDFHTDRIGNVRIMNYTKQEKVVFEVRIMYDDTRSLSELKAILETQTGAKEQSKELNGIKYIYYEYKTSDNLIAHHYMYVHKGKVYSVGFFLGENPGNIEEVFMNNVLFE